jgi:membrane protease YdiL (CAAX protease family)
MRKKSDKSFIIFIVLFFIVWSLRATLFYYIDQSIASDFWQMVYTQLMKVILWVLPACLYIKLINKASITESLKLGNPKGKWRSISAWLAAFTIIMLGAPSIQAGMLPHPPAAGWLVLLLTNIVSPASEEILFRGFILNKLMGSTSFWKANLITSLLFAAIHIPFWSYARGLNWGVAYDLGVVMVLSIILGYLFKKFNSLIPPILAHMINNMIPSLV